MCCRWKPNHGDYVMSIISLFLILFQIAAILVQPFEGGGWNMGVHAVCGVVISKTIDT